ncbi:MAG: hypothetical protein NVSMB16_10560 [Acidimicrobiales bacterium]
MASTAARTAGSTCPPVKGSDVVVRVLGGAGVTVPTGGVDVVEPPDAGLVLAVTGAVVVVAGEMAIPGEVVVVTPAAVVVVAPRVVDVLLAAVVDVVETPAVQMGRVTLLASSVVAPFRASSRPATEAPVLTLMDVRASTVPTNVELVPIVAELVTCQKTLHGSAPLITDTRLDEAVMRVLAAWNTKTALGSPPALSVTVPVKESAPPR